MMGEIEATKKIEMRLELGGKNLRGFNLKRTWMGEPPGNSGSMKQMINKVIKNKHLLKAIKQPVSHLTLV